MKWDLISILIQSTCTFSIEPTQTYISSTENTFKQRFMFFPPDWRFFETWRSCEPLTLAPAARPSSPLSSLLLFLSTST